MACHGHRAVTFEKKIREPCSKFANADYERFHGLGHQCGHDVYTLYRIAVLCVHVCRSGRLAEAAAARGFDDEHIADADLDFDRGAELHDLAVGALQVAPA